MSDQDITAKLDLDTGSYTRSIQDAIRASEDFDSALSDLVDQANEAEKSLRDLKGDVEINLETDTSSLDSAEETITSLDGQTVDVAVDVDDSSLSTIDGLADETVSITFDADTSQLDDAQTLVTNIDSEVPVIPFDADTAELDTVQTTVDNLDSETVDIPVETDTQDADKDTALIADKLTTLRNLAIINIVMQLAGSIPSPADIPLLGTIIEADKAARSIVASLGDMGKQNAPTYTKGATDVYASGSFDTQQAAADAYANTVRLTHNELGDMTSTGENFAKVTEQGFATAKSSGADFNEVIRTADTLVKTGLAPTYTDAFDIINTGFQEGLDKGGQFLDTMNEKSTVFVDMGLDAQTALGLIKIGLDNGAKSANEVGEVISSLDQKIQEAASGGGATYDLFKKLGLKDEIKAYNAGTETGGQFLTGLLAAIQEKQGTRGFDTQGVMGLFGGKVQDLTLDVAMKFDPAQAQNAVSEVKGTTLDTQLQVMGDLGTSWETLKRTVETQLATSVSTAFDIPGKIEQFNEGVRKFSDMIQNGATIPQAIEVAFQVPGFAETAANLESALGNLGIVLLQVAASILDAIGQKGAAQTVRGTVAEASAGQMAFDLKINAGNSEAIQSTIQTAIDRGVDSSTLAKGIATAGQEFISQGDLDSAKMLADNLTAITSVQMTPEILDFLAGKGIDSTNLQAVKEALEGIETTSQFGSNQIVSFGGLDPNAAMDTIDSINAALPAQDALQPLTDSLDTAQKTAEKVFAGMSMSATMNLPTVTDAIYPLTEGQQGLYDALVKSDEAFTTMTGNSTENAQIYIASLSTATGGVNDFANNTTSQIGTNIPASNDEAIVSFGLLGTQITGIMTQAKADIDDFVKHYLGIGSIDVTVPNPRIGDSGGGTGSQSHAAGGVVDAGRVDTVHGGEQLVYGGGQDIAVLNRQTSGVIDSAIAAYMGAAGMSGGGSSTTINNYNNIVFNNNGAAASAASIEASKIRGF